MLLFVQLQTSPWEFFTFLYCTYDIKRAKQREQSFHENVMLWTGRSLLRLETRRTYTTPSVLVYRQCSMQDLRNLQWRFFLCPKPLNIYKQRFYVIITQNQSFQESDWLHFRSQSEYRYHWLLAKMFTS